MSQQNPGSNVQTLLSDAAINSNVAVKRTNVKQTCSVANYGDPVIGVSGHKVHAANLELGVVCDGSMILTASGAIAIGQKVIVDAAGTGKGQNIQTITSVANATETFTKVAHGFRTGDAVYITSVGGVIPAGLVEGRVYYIINVTADTFRLADTSALATAGTAVNITGDGSGTLSAIEVAGDNLIGTACEAAVTGQKFEVLLK